MNAITGLHFLKQEGWKIRLGIIAFLILPVVFLIIGLNFNRTRYSNDPEYAYLMNGLNIARFQFVGHAENPGTTVQEISAFVIWGHYLTSQTDGRSLSEDVLLHPDNYIESIHRVLVVLNTLLLLFAGIFAFMISQALWQGLLLQLGIFLSANLLEHTWTKVSPESVLMMVATLLALAILHFHQKKNDDSGRFPLIFGLISGFGLATKVTFLPLLLIPFLLLKIKKERLAFLKWTVITAFVTTLPALLEYPHMAKWFLLVFIHKGTYGQGGIGVIDPIQYVMNLVEISGIHPFLGLTALCTVIFSIILASSSEIRQKYIGDLNIRFAYIIGLSQLLAILMVAKHYHADHYLIPAHCLTALVWVFLIKFLDNSLKSTNVPKYLIKTMIIIAFITVACFNYPYLKQANYGYRISNEEYTAVEKRRQQEFPGYLVSYFYPTSINLYSALHWGNVYSRGYNLPVLETLYPEGIFFDVRSKAFMQWEKLLDAKSLNDKYAGKILVVGGPMTIAEKAAVNDCGLKLEPVYQGRTQAIYKVDISNSTIFR
jgi:hypothetical protein